MTRPAEAAGEAGLKGMYRLMLRIRAFEDRAGRLFREGEVPGFLHLSVGQEAVAVGTCWSLGPGDVITSTHRGHGHVLAKGADMTAMFAELMGRETGTCRGRGGSMHIADVSKGIFGANGIVAGGLPIAVGAAAAARLRGKHDVAVAFFGEGAVAQGAFHESVNLAQQLALPVLFVCENNQFAEFTPTAGAPVSIEQRAAGYGVGYRLVDGNDVEAVDAATRELVAELRDGAPPRLLEALTWRARGHYEGDAQAYRDEATDAEWAARDPLARAASRLGEAGVPEDELAAIRAAVEEEADAAVVEARGAPAPDPATLHRYVVREREPIVETAASASEETKMIRAIRSALHHELEHDPSVFIAGIDVGAGGGVFGVTRGLADAFPGRVLDTPIAETALVGMGTGAAMAGMRPVIEIMYLDFIGVCLDQLLNQAAKLRYMTGGGADVPLTVRTQFGGGRSSGAQHSQSLEAILAHIPGLTVVMPSTPADAYGLLRAAIADPNPVIFIEHRHLYDKKGPAPDPDHIVPLGSARIVRQGNDVTIVSISRMVHAALAAAENLAHGGIDAEVIDLRTVAPLDTNAVLESVARTNRLVIAHEAVTDFGIGAEIAAQMSDAGFWELDAPIKRVGAAAVPAPYAPELERAWLPGTQQIEAAVQEVVSG